MIDASFLAFEDNVTLQFDRVVATAPMELWAALTEPEELAKWLANAEFDASVGGAVHLVWPGSGEMRGTVQECNVPSLLEYTWDESDGSSLVRWEVASSGDGQSTLRLVHSGASKDGAAGFGAGWQSHLEALDVVMSGGISEQAQRDARYEELHSAYLEAVAEL
ncbi:MAG: SRPBCC family protein [Acidimicrobiales bacterium]